MIQLKRAHNYYHMGRVHSYVSEKQMHYLCYEVGEHARACLEAPQREALSRVSEYGGLVPRLRGPQEVRDVDMRMRRTKGTPCVLG